MTHMIGIGRGGSRSRQFLEVQTTPDGPVYSVVDQDTDQVVTLSAPEALLDVLAKELGRTTEAQAAALRERIQQLKAQAFEATYGYPPSASPAHPDFDPSDPLEGVDHLPADDPAQPLSPAERLEWEALAQMNPQDPFDPYCGRHARDMQELDSFIAHGPDQPVEPWERAQYVVHNEGTYNPENGHFACDRCYIKIGSPSSPTGWRAP